MKEDATSRNISDFVGDLFDNDHHILQRKIEKNLTSRGELILRSPKEATEKRSHINPHCIYLTDDLHCSLVLDIIEDKLWGKDATISVADAAILIGKLKKFSDFPEELKSRLTNFESALIAYMSAEKEANDSKCIKFFDKAYKDSDFRAAVWMFAAVAGIGISFSATWLPALSTGGSFFGAPFPVKIAITAALFLILAAAITVGAVLGPKEIRKCIKNHRLKISSREIAHLLNSKQENQEGSVKARLSITM